MTNKADRFVKRISTDVTAKLSELDFSPWETHLRSEGKIIHFRRKAASETHLLDLIFDKYGRYRCGIDMAKINGPTALTWYGEERPVDEISVSALANRHVLRGNSLLGRGQFVAPFFLRISNPETAADWIAQRIIDQFEIVENWFKFGKSSPELLEFSINCKAF